LDKSGGAIFETQVKEADGFPVIELTGEIDLSTSPVFKQRIYEIIESGKRDVIVDMNGLDFMDSTGLGVLVAALKKTRMEGGSIRLICNRNNILKVFTITGLDKVFAIYDNLSELLKS
jgi:anti-sigma B factor antagonist